MTILYTPAHDWIQIDGDLATVGITDHAQKQLGDLVYVQMPAIGASLKQGGAAAVVESTKAASEVATPLSGTVVDVNQAVTQEPGKINSDPMGDGWLFKLRLSDPHEIGTLLTHSAYEELIQ